MYRDIRFSRPPTATARINRSKRTAPMAARTIQILRRSLFNRASRKAIDPTYSAVMALSGVGVERYVVGASKAGQVPPNAFGQQDTCSGLGKRSSGDTPEHARRTYPTLFKACKFCQLVHSLFSISVQ